MRIPANNSSHCYKTHDELHYWTICNLPHDSIESLVKSRMAIQRKRGINYDNLRLLHRDPERTKDALQFSMALTNARSLVNKTFIINDLFVSRGLNMLCVPETWLSEGDFSPLSELLPNDCSYINSPRSRCRGGGLLTIFKNSLRISSLPPRDYESFELQTLFLDSEVPLAVVLVSRPPKYNRDYVNDFADLLGDIVLKFDKILLLGDFNIRVCCASDSLSNEFVSLIHSFDFRQFVTGPTHAQGHTLDLVLSHVVSVKDIEVLDTKFSDNKTVFFNVFQPFQLIGRTSVIRQSRKIDSLNRDNLNMLFETVYNSVFQNSLLHHLHIDDHLALFNSVCLNVMNSVAPLTSKSVKTSSAPWRNDNTICSLRQTCRRAERKWKDNLQISYEIFDSLKTFQRAMSEARNNFFSDVIETNQHKPNIINTALNPITKIFKEPSFQLCEEFLSYFITKAANLPLQPIPSGSVINDLSTHSSTWREFEPISLATLLKIIDQLKPTASLYDIIPSRFFKQIANTIGPSFLHVINKCLESGIVPDYMKYATVRPLLKKSNPDPSVYSHFRPISNLPFIAKILEKVVFNQLQDFLSAKFNFGYISIRL